jgi:hypothetical protein
MPHGVEFQLLGHEESGLMHGDLDKCRRVLTRIVQHRRFVSNALNRLNQSPVKRAETASDDDD